LKYLARYLTGGPISDSRIVSADEREVTFLAREGTTPGGEAKQVPITLTTPEFTRRRPTFGRRPAARVAQGLHQDAALRRLEQHAPGELPGAVRQAARDGRGLLVARRLRIRSFRGSGGRSGNPLGELPKMRRPDDSASGAGPAELERDHELAGPSPLVRTVRQRLKPCCRNPAKPTISSANKSQSRQSSTSDPTASSRAG